MVKITDKSNYSRFARPASEDEGIWLDHVEVHLVTHPVGQVKPMHTHDPPQDHVIVMRSGRMRWTVEDESLEAEAGDVIVTPAGTAHGYRFSATSPRASCASTRLRYRSRNREGVSKTLKIVGLGGSPADNSKSRAALRTALGGAASAGAATQLLDIRHLGLPMYNPDDHEPTETAATLIESCHAADGLLWRRPARHRHAIMRPMRVAASRHSLNSSTGALRLVGSSTGKDGA